MSTCKRMKDVGVYSIEDVVQLSVVYLFRLGVRFI